MIEKAAVESLKFTSNFTIGKDQGDIRRINIFPSLEIQRYSIHYMYSGIEMYDRRRMCWRHQTSDRRRL